MNEEAGNFLRGKIKERHAERARVATQLEKLDGEIQHLEFAIRILADGNSLAATKTPVPNGATLKTAVTLVLRDAQRALDGLEVVEELRGRGLRVKGPSVYSALSRMTANGLLMKAGRGKYAIAVKNEDATAAVGATDAGRVT